MKEIELHQHETSHPQKTESFLQENIEKLQGHAVFLLGLMLNGERLSAKMVVQKYGMEPRRLRDLYESGKCSREWMLNEKGKRTHVEYFCEIPKPSTKESIIAKAHEAQQNLEVAEKAMITVFELPDDRPSYHQQSLFP